MIDAIAETLGVEPYKGEEIVIVEHTEKEDWETQLTKFKEDALINASLDMEEARQNLKVIIAKGMAMLDDVADAVRLTQDSKAITSASVFISSLASVNMDMAKLNNDALKLSNVKQTANNKPAPQQPQQVTIENSNVVLASPADIMAENKKKKPWE